MAIVTDYKRLSFKQKTNERVGSQLWVFEHAARLVWNKVWWINKNRLYGNTPILRYSQMAALLVFWKRTEELGWLKTIPSQVLQQVLMDLDRAYKDGFDKRQPGKRLPLYKRRQDCVGLRFPQGFKFDNRRIFFPKIGWVGFFKSQEIVGHVKSVTAKVDGVHWKASVLVAHKLEGVKHPSTEVTGIDVGVAKFVMLSDGTVYKTISTEKLDRKIKREQRNLSRKKKGSKNRGKQVLVVQKPCAKRARIHNDHSHKASSAVSKKFAIACLEDLRVSCMSRSARGTVENPGRNVRAKSGLNRAILAQGFRKFRTQLEYKMRWNGGTVVVVDPRHTSQICSSCGVKSAESRRSQSLFECVHCGFTINADVNAAINIRNRGLNLLAAGQAVTVCGGGAVAAPRKQKPAGNRERVLAHVIA